MHALLSIQAHLGAHCRIQVSASSALRASGTHGLGLLVPMGWGFHCSLHLLFWKGKGQIPFFKAQQGKSKLLVGFEPRTEASTVATLNPSLQSNAPLRPPTKTVLKFNT